MAMWGIPLTVLFDMGQSLCQYLGTSSSTRQAAKQILGSQNSESVRAIGYEARQCKLSTGQRIFPGYFTPTSWFCKVNRWTSILPVSWVCKASSNHSWSPSGAQIPWLSVICSPVCKLHMPVPRMDEPLEIGQISLRIWRKTWNKELTLSALVQPS